MSEGLRLDGGVHPLTDYGGRNYGKENPNRTAAPLRLVVPLEVMGTNQNRFRGADSLTDTQSAHQAGTRRMQGNSGFYSK